MAESIRLKGVTAKIESVYQTDATPTPATDAVQVEDNFWGNIEIGYMEENLRENLAVAGMGRAGLSHPEGRWVHLTIPVAIKGTGSVLTQASEFPEWDVLMRAAGHQATWDATGGSESVTYTPRSTGFESATIYAYSANAVFKCVGMYGTLTNLSLMPAQYPIATFDLWGVLLEDPSELALPAFTYAQKGVEPPTVKNAGFTVDGYDPADFRSLVLETRTTLPQRPGGNAANGHYGFFTSDWNPRLVAVIDKPPLGTFNPYTYRKNGTLFAWDIGPIGADQYNQITVSGPKGKIVGLPHSEQDSLALIDMEIRLQNTDEETPDDAYSILID